MSILVSGAVLGRRDGEVEADLRIDQGRITEVGKLRATTSDEVIDGAGWLVLPAPAEPHAHLDKALTADEVHNETGDLLGAIKAWRSHRATLSIQDIERRATAAVRLGIRNGMTAMRTHVDLGSDIGLTGLQAMLGVRDQLADVMTLQIVGLIGTPLTGPAGKENRAVLRDALDAGLPIVGGVPHLDEDPTACTRWLVEMATEHGRDIDLHTDENLRTSSLDLETLAELVTTSAFTGSVTASHCVSLGMQSEAVQRRVADKVAEAGISVIALPQTNLFLQAREQAVAPPRGLTAISALIDAGVNVAGGADNLQDPFCTVGRGDALETASLLVMAGHMTPAGAYDAVSNRARQAMGLEPITLSVGDPADVLMVQSRSIREAVAMAPSNRIVIRGGVAVFRAGELSPLPGSSE